MKPALSIGRTVTLTVCEGPAHAPARVERGVTVDITTWFDEVLLVIVLFSTEVVSVVLLSPLVFTLSLAIQV